MHWLFLLYLDYKVIRRPRRCWSRLCEAIFKYIEAITILSDHDSSTPPRATDARCLTIVFALSRLRNVIYPLATTGPGCVTSIRMHI